MRNTKKSAFTLVELIVVITILAILGTIAFISLQGYSQDAKNAKVAQDLATLSSAVEVGLTDWSLTGLSTLVTTPDLSAVANNGVNTASWITVYDRNNVATKSTILSLGATKYKVGSVDFAALRQNGDDFKDPEGKNYIAAIAYSGSTSYYQLAGQKKENSWDYTLLIKGNYVAQIGDTLSLISGKNTAGVALVNGASKTTTILY